MAFCNAKRLSVNAPLWITFSIVDKIVDNSHPFFGI